MNSNKTSIAIIYTGGTIGMMEDALTKSLKPVDFTHITDHVPEINRLNIRITQLPFGNPIDSSNMSLDAWKKLAQIIFDNHALYDGFVVLHGSDTMSYTASALSFMLENVQKPIVFTGSQLPIGVARTDGKENLLTALEIAASTNEKGEPMVPEVCLYFEYQLYRGSRTRKYSAENFKAFESPNYPVLAQAGVHISFNYSAIRILDRDKKLILHDTFCDQVAVLYLFPGMSSSYVRSFEHIQELKGLVVCSFGSGNFPNRPDLTDVLTNLCQKGVAVVNITQCNMGEVDPLKYSTNPEINALPMINGHDLTLEAALAKLMFLLGQNHSISELKTLFETSLCGELTQRV